MSNYDFKKKIKEVTKRELSFEPKSIWNHQTKTNLDKIIIDEISQKTINDTTKDDWMSFGSGSFMSKFNTEYAKRIIEFWTKEGDLILDPFAGRTRSLISTLLKRRYFGFDVVKDNIDNMINSYSELSKKYKMGELRLYNDDSYNLNRYIKESVNLVMTCPPYWNLEKYPEGNGVQLSLIESYESFLKRYEEILLNASDKLIDGGFFAIVISNWRTDNTFYDFRTDTSNILKKKLLLYDEIILEMSGAKRHPLYPQAITKLKMLKTHEYLLIFRKANNTSEYQNVNDEINFNRPYVKDYFNTDELFWKNKKDWINNFVFGKKNKFFEK